MNQEQQRLTIAKYCDIGPFQKRNRDGKPSRDGTYVWHQYCLGGGAFEWRPIPDYCNDLNAINKVVLTLGEGPHDELGRGRGTQYAVELRKIVKRDYDYEEGPFFANGTICDLYFYEASAAQRCEAFLKAIKQWQT